MKRNWKKMTIKQMNTEVVRYIKTHKIFSKEDILRHFVGGAAISEWSELTDNFFWSLSDALLKLQICGIIKSHFGGTNGQYYTVK